MSISTLGLDDDIDIDMGGGGGDCRDGSGSDGGDGGGDCIPSITLQISLTILTHAPFSLGPR